MPQIRFEVSHSYWYAALSSWARECHTIFINQWQSFLAVQSADKDMFEKVTSHRNGQLELSHDFKFHYHLIMKDRSKLWPHICFVLWQPPRKPFAWLWRSHEDQMKIRKLCAICALPLNSLAWCLDWLVLSRVGLLFWRNKISSYWGN